ncbi:PucR family transcriptional regulator [Aquabacterium sp.]|uniref:PucR family transcriptional regulator n=1 Tax=Aquabacterium sp. TaxID=1872578 RepID=UPI003D6D2474
MALNAPPEWIDEIDQASLTAGARKVFAEDPVLLAASRRATHMSMIHWASANVENPGAPVSAHLTVDMLSATRELVRRGAMDTWFQVMRAGERAAWQRLMSVAFALASDQAELQELLEVSSRSIGTFMDATIDAMTVFMKTEHEELMRGTHVDRRALVARILEGASVSTQAAGHRLGYLLDQTHHAAVIWSEEADSELSQLERAAQALALCAGTGTGNTLTVIANAATLWVWTNGAQAIDLAQLRLALKSLPGVRMTLSFSGQGIEGFRRTHLDALTTQRVLGRVHSSARVVSFDMVRLVSLMTRDAEANQQFLAHTLGNLATANPLLRRTLLVFLNTGSNLTKAAELLHTHRNTLLRRLARAQELLPRPLEQNLVHVAAALESLSWTGEDQS